MGTSRRRTRPPPVLAGPPQGARTAYRDRQKTSKSPFGFKRETEFSAAYARKIIQLSLAFTKWINGPRYSSLIGSTRRLASVR